MSAIPAAAGAARRQSARTGVTNTPNNYAIGGRAILSTSSAGFAPITNANIHRFRLRHRQCPACRRLRLCQRRDPVRRRRPGGQVDPNGQLFIANTAATGSLKPAISTSMAARWASPSPRTLPPPTPVVLAHQRPATISRQRPRRPAVRQLHLLRHHAASVSNPTTQTITLISAPNAMTDARPWRCRTMRRCPRTFPSCSKRPPKAVGPRRCRSPTPAATRPCCCHPVAAVHRREQCRRHRRPRSVRRRAGPVPLYRRGAGQRSHAGRGHRHQPDRLQQRRGVPERHQCRRLAAEGAADLLAIRARRLRRHPPGRDHDHRPGHRPGGRAPALCCAPMPSRPAT